MKYFVSCTSSTNLKKEYYDLMRKVLKIIYDNNNEIYLGILLDNISDTLKKYSDKIICYSLEEYKDEINNCPDCKYIIVNNQYERNNRLIKETDGLILLPGGTGTLFEFFGALEQYKIEDNNKKIIIINYNNFYNEIFTLLNKMVDENLLKPEYLDYIKVLDIEKLDKYMKEGI